MTKLLIGTEFFVIIQLSGGIPRHAGRIVLVFHLSGVLRVIDYKITRQMYSPIRLGLGCKMDIVAG